MEHQCQLKWSQEELAIKVGKKRPYISRVENGEDLRISNFIQIANVLGLNFELKTGKIELVDEEESIEGVGVTGE
jgi:transcriptional regulator with XRE-family HTH domain